MAFFENKIVVVTGGAQGIGKGIAKYFLQHQAIVIIIDADKQAGKETQAEYQSLRKTKGSIVNIASTRAASKKK